MRQVETSRTLVFDDDVHARAFFEALLCENMDLGRPENAELLFRRGQRLGRPTLPPPGDGFKTKIDRYCDLVTLNVFCKNSRLKQHLKDGVATGPTHHSNSPPRWIPSTSSPPATSPRPASPPQPDTLHNQCPAHRRPFTVPPDSSTPSLTVKLRTNIQTPTPKVS
jgi:hypothetical protein